MNVLITGKGSYIGEHIRDYLLSKDYSVYELDTMSDKWKSFDYSHYDTIVHVAAIVHENAKNASEELFTKVNTELPYEIASLAKKAGVGQFAFLSTMAVFGCDKKLPKGNVVSSDTNLNPTSLYGISKLAAEEKLSELADESFKISIVRPPNVYGKSCQGNYMNGFRKISSKLSIFPYVYNDAKQSVLYIDNLSALVYHIIDNNSEGVFLPQDDYAPSSCEMVKAISDAIGKKTHFSKFLGYCVKPFSIIAIVKKLYGGVSYTEADSECFDGKYRIVSFQEGIRRTFE